jgi:hypothetical protein
MILDPRPVMSTTLAVLADSHPYTSFIRLMYALRFCADDIPYAWTRAT